MVRADYSQFRRYKFELKTLNSAWDGLLTWATGAPEDVFGVARVAGNQLQYELLGETIQLSKRSVVSKEGLYFEVELFLTRDDRKVVAGRWYLDINRCLREQPNGPQLILCGGPQDPSDLMELLAAAALTSEIFAPSPK